MSFTCGGKRGSRTQLAGPVVEICVGVHYEIERVKPRLLACGWRKKGQFDELVIVDLGIVAT